MGCKPCPHHCPSGSGGPVAMLVILAVIVIAAARPIAHGAEVAVHVMLIAAAVTAVLAVTAAVAYAAFRIRRWRARTRPARPAHRLSARSAQTISAARRNKAARPAIEAPRPRVTTKEGIIWITQENR
jgi:hypothetical protein